jgi:hypothetical protein
MTSTPSFAAPSRPNKKRKHTSAAPEDVEDKEDPQTLAQVPAKRKRSAPEREEVAAAISTPLVASYAKTMENRTASSPRKKGRTQNTPTQQQSRPNDGPIARSSKENQYSEQEFATMDETVENFQHSNGLTREEVIELIHANAGQQSTTKDAPTPKQLWDELAAAVTTRPRQSIQKCARRRYMRAGLKKGDFSKEEDEQLLEIVRSIGPNPSWVVVGKELNRSSGAVRDRYRHYLSHSREVRKDVWNGDEEAQFALLIFEQRKKHRSDYEEKVRRNVASGPYDPSSFWPTFSIIEKRMEEMDMTRSNLQLRNKYNKMLKAQARTMANNDQSPTRDPGRKSARVQTAENHWEKKMQPGDKYECLQAILAGMMKYKRKTEDKIPWSEIQRDNKDSKWETPERKVVFEKMKAVAGTNPNDDAINILKAQICWMEDNHSDQLSQHFSGPRRKGVVPKQKKGSSNIVSKAVISDEDEDEDDHVNAALKSASPKSDYGMASNSDVSVSRQLHFNGKKKATKSVSQSVAPLLNAKRDDSNASHPIVRRHVSKSSSMSESSSDTDSSSSSSSSNHGSNSDIGNGPLKQVAASKRKDASSSKIVSSTRKGLSKEPSSDSSTSSSDSSTSSSDSSTESDDSSDDD